MRLISFHVRGFKNFRQEIGLKELSAINVVHGANNVGKSNLIQAMTLYFQLLGLEQDGWLPFSTDRRITDEEFESLGFTRSDLFNIESPEPIEMRAEIVTDPQELTRAGIKPLLPSDRVSVEFVLSWMGSFVAFRIKRFVFADGTEAAALQSSPDKIPFVLRFAAFLAKKFLIRTESADRFALIPVSRLLNPDLALRLYDAKESTDMEVARQW